VGGNLRGEDNEDKTDNQVKTKQNTKVQKMRSVLKLSLIFVNFLSYPSQTIIRTL
jgi:hypothetical protein